MNKLTATLFFYLLLPVALVASPIPSAGVVGWWRAEGNILDSAGRHDGTLPFGMNYAPGKVGLAFDFDGNSRNRVSIPDSPDFRLTNALTIEGWIYPRQYGGYVFFYGDDRAGLDPWKVDLDSPGFIAFQIEDSQNRSVRIQAPIQLNQWQHFAATLGRRGFMKLYVNGTLAAQTNTTLRPLGNLDPTQNPAIGIGNTGGTVYQSPFHGLIDEIALYSRALSQSEVQSIYHAVGAGQRVEAVTSLVPAELTLREIRYDGRLSDDEARFTVDIDAEANGKGESSVDLFEGDVAVLPAKLSDQLKIVREGNRYLLVAAHPGQFKLKLDLVVKIQRAEPWNQISFAGPAATIASVDARANGAGMEVQLLSGTLLESDKTNGVSRVRGFLGGDQTVALRWQGKISEVTRKALLTVDSTINVQATPAALKYTSHFHYDIVQGNAAQLMLVLPATQALTRLVGEQIRDWHSATEGDRQVLTIEFIKPVEKAYDLTLYSEQAVEDVPQSGTGLSLNPPRPLGAERESGSLTLSAEDMAVEIESLAGLRQVNAPAEALAAYRFNGRPFTLALKLKRIEPVINVADRVSARLEETRLVISHGLTLNVEKAGVYAVELTPQPGLVVAEVRGDGIEDWKASEGKLRVNFSARALGSRKLEMQLEQALKNFLTQISVAPLRVTGAARETAEIGAASAPGIRLRTAELVGLREIPVRTLQSKAGGTPALPSDELLAYSAEQPDWRLSLASERLSARVVADVFNLVTIGDGIAGGSATIRYSLVNQGVQEFKVKLPSHCRNVEFTGPNIRRKEMSRGSSVEGRAPESALDSRLSTLDTNYVVWTIGLQDKVWGGYTLVVTYDYPFGPGGATLPVGGVHPLDAERETGSVAITTAASLQLNAATVSDTLRRVDESELSPNDRGLIARAVVLAYQYTGNQYDLTVDVKHYEQERVLEAVADRTQLTSVLTEAGEMLTQASFMVKNNEKQFQRFLLPKGASLWGCYVNGQPAKPERDGDWVLASLPRDANRDQAFAVDIMYAEKKGLLVSRWAHSLELTAPRTDVPNTYAEWQLFVPPSLRLSHFGGSMNVSQGTTYGVFDAWQKFLTFYVQVLHEAGAAILVIGILTFLVIALVISAVRRGWNGIITLLVVMAILAVLGAMMMPALSRARYRSTTSAAINNLRQVDAAVQQFALENAGRMPSALDELKTYLGRGERGGDVLTDPASGQQFIYLGTGLPLEQLRKDSVLAYSPADKNGHCTVLFADGNIQSMAAGEFVELSQHGLVKLATPEEIAQQRQGQAVMESQFRGPTASQPAAPLPAPESAHEVAPPAPAPAETPAANVTGYVVTTTGLPVAPGAPAPAVAGIHSIRIELPQTGQPFLFTKVLNIRDEPLSIRARMMSLRTYQNIQMAWQVAAFLLGLIVWWWHWSRRREMRRSSFMLTLALALMIGSVCSLLIQWRALHDALIVGFPVATLAVIACLIWRYWPRSSNSEISGTAPPEPPPLGGSVPPLSASILLGFLIGAHSLSAATIGNPSIVSARYSGTVNERVASLDAVLRFSSTEAGQIMPLFGEDVALQQFLIKNGDAKLVRDGNNIAVRLGSRGEVTVELKMLVKVAGDVTKRRLLFGIPPALSSQVTLALDQPEADVEFPTAISFKRELTKDKTRVEAVIGSADHVELLWTPRMKRAAEVTATVFCQNISTVTFGGGVANVRSRLDYQITQGELRQARVQLPQGQRFLRIEGLSIRNWELKDENGAPVLVVDLLKGISPAWRLTVETEKVLEALPVSTSVDLPHALEVKRETGLVSLRSAEELGLSVESTSDLQRVDVEEFSREAGDKTDGLLSVFRFTKPEFKLRLRVEAVQPQIEAIVRNHVRAGTDQVTLSAAIDYTIKRAGVFALKVALPEGYRIEQVIGRNILQWTEHTEGGSPRGNGTEAGARVLQVTLKERTSGACTLNLELTRSFNELPRSLAIAGVQPLDTVKLTGFVAVSTEPGVAAKTESFEGLTEIPAVSLPDYTTLAGTGNVLAYKFISSELKSAPAWKLNVATETIDAWVRAETINTITLAETLVSGRALVRYDIANAPIKELRLKVPAAFRNVEITGPNIRSKEVTSRGSKVEGRVSENALDTNYLIWRVELQNKTRGLYTLPVTWEQPRASKTSPVEIGGVSAEGVERETGMIVIAAKTGLQVRELSAVDLQRVDPTDIPDWAGRPDDAAALAYHYVRPGYKLTLEARRFDEAEVLQALVDSARFTSVVADDGQTMTEMTLSVRNNGRQFLELELPQGADVWSSFVAGQPVRPSQRKGKLLLPIAQSGADEGGLSVELTYVGTNLFPRVRGQVVFDSPKFDVPVKNVQWELFLPPGYNYRDLQGTMTPEVAAQAPSSMSFSLLDYTRMERASKASAQADVKRDVSYAEQKLSGGNVREAVASFSRAKASAAYSKEDAAGVKELEKKLSTAQASNLIIAQNEFAFRNAGQNIELNAPAQPQAPGMQYDNSSAEQQWAKLQQAQEIVIAKVQPLHVNLPLRGQRYAFNQVLQTEIGKPMTIRLLAASAKAVSWPKRVATTFTGFLVLWGIVVVVLRVPRRQA